MPTRLDAVLVETFSFPHSHATLWSTGKLHIFSGPLTEAVEGELPKLRMTNTLPLHEDGTLQKLLEAVDALFAVVIFTAERWRSFSKSRSLLAEFNEGAQGESVRFVLDSKLSLPSQAALIVGILINARLLKPPLLGTVVEQLVPFENHHEPTLDDTLLYPYPHMAYGGGSQAVSFIRHEDDYRASVLIYTFLATAPAGMPWGEWKQAHWDEPFTLFNKLSVEEVFPELRPLWPHLVSFPASLTPEKLRLLAAILPPTSLNPGTFRALVEYLPEDLLQKLRTSIASKVGGFTGYTGFTQKFLHYLLDEQVIAAYRVLNKYRSAPTEEFNPAHAELYAMVYHIGGVKRFDEFAAMVRRGDVIPPQGNSLAFLAQMKNACSDEWQDYPLDLAFMVA